MFRLAQIPALTHVAQFIAARDFAIAEFPAFAPATVGSTRFCGRICGDGRKGVRRFPLLDETGDPIRR